MERERNRQTCLNPLKRVPKLFGEYFSATEQKFDDTIMYGR